MFYSHLWNPPSNLLVLMGVHASFHIIWSSKKKGQNTILHDFSLCSISIRWLPCRHSFDVPSPGKLLDSGDFLLMSHQSAEHRGHGLTARDYEDSASTGHGFLAKLKQCQWGESSPFWRHLVWKWGTPPNGRLKGGLRVNGEWSFFWHWKMEWSENFQSAEKRRKLDTGSCMVLSWSFMYFPSLHGRLREINIAFMLNAVLDDFRHVGASENEVYQPFLAIK